MARSAFSSQNVKNEKWHAAAARSTIFKSKCTKHTSLGQLWMWKNGMLLWREAHFQVKMHKTHQPRPTFGAAALSTCSSQNVLKKAGFGPLLEVQMWKTGMRPRREAHLQVKYTKHTMFGPLFGASGVEKRIDR